MNERIKNLEKEIKFLQILAESEVNRSEQARINENFIEAYEALNNSELIIKRARKLLEEVANLAYEELMTPLEVLKELVDILGMKFNLTDEELSETLKKSGQNKFYSRVGWARTYLNAAKLIDVPRKAVFKINQRGKQTLIDKPENILNYLKQFDEFLEFLNKYKEENPS